MSPLPWALESHVHPNNIARDKGEMVLLPNFRLPTLIHTRSANAKWLYEISHNNPVWMHVSDAEHLGVDTGDLVRVETEIGWFVDKVWVTDARECNDAHQADQRQVVAEQDAAWPATQRWHRDRCAGPRAALPQAAAPPAQAQPPAADSPRKSEAWFSRPVRRLVS